MSVAPGGFGPDLYGFPDRGCEYAPSCLACHLLKCRYDVKPAEVEALASRTAMRAAYGWGVTKVGLMTAFGVSRRTVDRVLATG